jgi:two-component system NtrC family response regulator/two-component system response regulator HydG
MATGLRRVGYEVSEFDGADAALGAVSGDDRIDVLITDVRMPGMDGYQLLGAVRSARPELPVLMVTAFGDIDGAVRALKDGANDYLSKPVNLAELRHRVEQLLEREELSQEKRQLEQRLERLVGAPGLVAHSPSMVEVLERVKVVAPAPSTVLIVGESGTGKELIANAIHQQSPRSARRFMALNCGAIPGEILEAELFGHERGAFTGAHQRRVGLIESADGGTLFLDEISELSPDLQVKLLRVLEQRTVTRVGGNEEIPVDFRLVAATNRELDAEAAAGRFRQDLYYRLRVVVITLPPLRERPEDIPPLVSLFLDRFNRDLDRRIASVDPPLLAQLQARRWPGNVRELRNVVENMVLFARGTVLTVADLPPEPGRPASPAPADGEWRPRSMAELEREAIERTLAFTEGHRARAAQLLGIGLRTLQRKLKEYGLATNVS